MIEIAGSERLERRPFKKKASSVAAETVYTYEPNRNLATVVEYLDGGSSVGRYEYAYDALARRSSVINTGSAFAADAFNAYQYNDRSDLLDAKRPLCTNGAETTYPVTAEDFVYGYDAIGNRETFTL